MWQKSFTFILFMACFGLHLEAQVVLEVKDIQDSTVVPGAVLRMKHAAETIDYSSDERGRILLSHTLVDSLVYELLWSASGYASVHQHVFGAALQGSYYLIPEVHELENVVITAQYRPQQASESMHQVKIIDAQKIEQMGALNLRDVLTNTNNVRLSQDNILGSSMSMQGISGENVKILIDGVPLIGRQNGNLDLSQINLQNIERIEIIEGPLSVQYGTNALAGTINLITKNTDKKSKQVQLSTQYESIGNYNTSLSAQCKLKQVHLGINLGRNFFDGWSTGDRNFNYVRESRADASRFQEWKPKEQYFVEGSMAYKYKATSFSYKPSYFKETILNRGKPIGPYYEKAFDDTYTTLRNNHAITLATGWGKYWKINLIAAYNHYSRIKQTYFNDLTTLSKVLSENSSDQDTSKLNLLLSRGNFVHAKDSARVNYELGYDFNCETAHGKRIEGGRKTLGDYALYTTAEYKIKHLSIKPGLRAAYNTAYRTPLVPSLHLRYALNSKNVLRGSYARGFRAPSLKELYFFFVDINHNIVGNPELRSEYSHNYALSYLNQSRLGSQSLQSNLSFFYNHIDNMITLAYRSGTQYSYVNVGKYKTKGAQASVAWQIKSFKINTGLSYVGRYNGQSERYDVPAFSYSPEVNGSLEYHLKKHHLVLATYYKYNGKTLSYQITEDEVRESFINAYQILDLSVQKGLLKQRLSMTLGCKNLFNVTNLRASMAGTGAHSSSSNSLATATGRNFFVKLNWKLFK
jgi:outer membrane receptor for ferrienterochelin and colicins